MVTFNDIIDPRLVTALRACSIGVLPSDTVYGLACSAGNTEAVARLYAAKYRDEHKPGTVIAANIDQLVTLGIKRRYLKAVEDSWPNPLSVVIPVGPELDYITQNNVGLAVRIPSDTKLQALLAQTGPLLTTNANMPGEPVANTISEARQYFSDTVDFYVDGGDLSGRPPSTLIRIIDDAVEVLRSGAVKLDLPD